MIEQIEISDVAKETIDVLKYFSSSFVSKIPVQVLDKLKELAKQSNITVNIDKNKKLKEQDISEETKSMISLIYYEYIATEEEQKQITKIWNENENLYQTKIKEKYDVNNIFKKDIQEETPSTGEESTQLIVYKKDNILKNILNRISEFFRRLINNGGN